MSTDPDEPSFLARWSRMKRGEAGAKPEPVPDHHPPAADAAPLALQRDQLPKEAEPDLPALELPRIEDLTADSDFTVFLQKGVPQELQRLALRRAWSLDPAIRDFIEVAENQYDWNAVDGVPGFGPLDPGTNLKRLLAQATGQPWPAEAGGSDVAEKLSHPELPDPRVGVAAQDERFGQPVAAGRPTADEDEPAADDTTPAPCTAEIAQVPHVVEESDAQLKPAPDFDPPPPLRRRHGGALPE